MALLTSSSCFSFLHVLLWVVSVYRPSVCSFPLDLLQIALDTTSADEFGGDDRAFAGAVDWQASRLSSSAAPFVGCVDYVDGRQVRIRLEGVLGADAVRTVHHSRDHGVSCFLFHALGDQARQLLEEPDKGDAGGRVRLRHLAAFPANLKVKIEVAALNISLACSRKIDRLL